MSVQEIIEKVRKLSIEEQKELFKLLVDIVAESQAEAPQKQRSLRELRGLGKEIWAGIDAQEYVDQQRDEWDRKA